MNDELEVAAWITSESLHRLKYGGNYSRGTVPVHKRESVIAYRGLVLHTDAERLLAERDARIAQLERERDEACLHLRAVVSEVEDLIGESCGVYGLHLNGDAAPWSELVAGGRFERIASVAAAREYIDAAMKGGE